jgi:hypothetical protein
MKGFNTMSTMQQLRQAYHNAVEIVRRAEAEADNAIIKLKAEFVRHRDRQPENADDWEFIFTGRE